MSFQKTMASVTRRNFFAVPGAVALGVLGARKASACTVVATCVAENDTSVTIRVVFGGVAVCNPIPNVITVTGTPGGIGPRTFAGNPSGTTNITIDGLTCGVAYTFSIFGSNGTLVSDITTVVCTTRCAQGCTRTQGYWKNHPDAWPVASLSLGNPGTVYSKAGLLAILGMPVRGNGLMSLAHQLIAAKLNVAAGASSAPALAAITAADNLIGTRVVGIGYLEPSATSALVGTLDSFNNGNLGPFHCT